MSVFSPRARQFVDTVRNLVEHRAPRAIVERIADLVREQERWRRGACLNMNPAEGLISLGARALLDSDLATRLTEGLPGDKSYPHGPQNEATDEIEATIITLAQRLFGARYVEWRPVSNTMANAAVFFALLEPGDPILVQDEEGGGNFSYHARGPAGLARTKIDLLPRQDPMFEIALDGLEQTVRKSAPKMIVIGGGKVLFPYPVRRLREIADTVGAILLYDAAHLGLHIGAGRFQRPLEEGAHVVTLSTHKVMGGPVGGLVLTNDAAIAERIVKMTFPGLMQTRDLNKYAALAVTLAEIAAFGRELANQMVLNARALAAALAGEGFEVLAADRGYTETHQLFLSLGEAAPAFESRCHDANILITDCALGGDLALGRRSGARIATHEVTRLGMRAGEMSQIAALIAGAHGEREPVEKLRARVQALVARFPTIQYSFDATEA
jgi:glycine hydroxymethyltransferase